MLYPIKLRGRMVLLARLERASSVYSPAIGTSPSENPAAPLAIGLAELSGAFPKLSYRTIWSTRLELHQVHHHIYQEVSDAALLLRHAWMVDMTALQPCPQQRVPSLDHVVAL